MFARKTKKQGGSPAFFMLVALHISIEPFANKVAGNICYDRYQE